MLNPDQIVEKMMATDAMSQWLGIKIKRAEKGNIVCEMEVRPDMVNGFNIAHGGISYSFADSALAFSVNSNGIHAVSIETSISHLKPIFVGNLLRTETKQLSLSNKIGVYQVDLFNDDIEHVASFKGTVYRTGKIWE